MFRFYAWLLGEQKASKETRKEYRRGGVKVHRMLFPWTKHSRRQELLAEPFPPAWEQALTAHVRAYPALPAAAQQKMRETTRILIAEKNWEGARGLTVTEEMQVAIAAGAAQLTLGFDHDYFPNVETILVYPQGFLVRSPSRGEGGVIAEEILPLVGQAAMQGPVIISWADVEEERNEPSRGHNVILHEFAHKLDMRDGSADGAPYLRDAAQIDDWAQVMSAEYERLAAQKNAGEPSLLDPYGATNAAEFFAVATEVFFELPRQMASMRPELYRVLRGYYNQDPAAWNLG